MRVVTSSATTSARTDRRSSLQSSWLALAFVTVVSVGIGWVVAGRLLAPVHTITARAQRISADSLDERIALGGPRDELRALADTFDALLGRVQSTVTSERRLVATMSHELRTPLANQQAALDVALADPDADADELRAAATTALEQSRRAARTIDALLVLARAQSGEATGPPGPRGPAGGGRRCRGAGPHARRRARLGGPPRRPRRCPASRTCWPAPSRTSWTTPRTTTCRAAASRSR